MKLLVPLFKKLPIETGVGIRNISLLKKLSKEAPLTIRLWRGFDVTAEKSVSFSGSHHLQSYLPEHFSSEQISVSNLATVEFDESQLTPDDRVLLHKDLFETQCLLRSQGQKTRANILYDLIADKKPGHRYTPILHCAHTGYVSSEHETWAVLTNFRPPYLKAEKETQSMTLHLRSPEGQLLHERVLEIPFNATTEISFQQEFAAFGGFKPGCQMNFKGGQSQFAIFTVFWNQKSQAIGIEHSLPPIYYCSNVYHPQSRQTFYKNAFSDIKGFQ